MTNKEIYKALRKALDEMHKEEEAETLAYFKRELLKHLNTLKDEAHTERIEKAIFMLTLIAKSGYPVGTVRTWRGTKFKKIAQGKWRRIYDKEDRGAKMSIARLKKQVEKCESTKELLDLVLQNKSRFMDENGKPLSIVKELSAYAKEKGREKIKERAQKTQGLRNHFARQNKKEQESKNGIVEKNELTEKQIKNAVEPTQAEFENIIDNIFLGNYKAVPSAIKLPSLQKELIEKLGVSGNFYLTQKRMKHINPQRKASHNNQDFRKEEYKDILNMIKNAKRAYIDTAKGNFLIAKKDKMNENKANIICFNKDKLGNYIVTIKKVDKVELKKQGLEKVEVGVSPTITRQNGAPASNGHTCISTDNSIQQKAASVNNYVPSRPPYIETKEEFMKKYEQELKERGLPIDNLALDKTAYLEKLEGSLTGSLSALAFYDKDSRTYEIAVRDIPYEVYAVNKEHRDLYGNDISDFYKGTIYHDLKKHGVFNEISKDDKAFLEKLLTGEGEKK